MKIALTQGEKSGVVITDDSRSQSKDLLCDVVDANSR